MDRSKVRRTDGQRVGRINNQSAEEKTLKEKVGGKKHKKDGQRDGWMDIEIDG